MYIYIYMVPAPPSSTFHVIFMVSRVFYVYFWGIYITVCMGETCDAPKQASSSLQASSRGLHSKFAGPTPCLLRADPTP